MFSFFNIIYYEGKSDSAENVGIILMFISVLALLKLPMFHTIFWWMFSLLLICITNVSLLLHGSCVRWQLVSLTGDLRSSVWLIGSGIEGRGHHRVLQAERSWNLVGPCPPGISFHVHLPVCNLALWLLPSQMISCFPLPALYLVQVPQPLREKEFQRFAWGWKAGSHVRKSTLSDPALILCIAACRMPVACLPVSTWFC